AARLLARARWGGEASGWDLELQVGLLQDCLGWKEDVELRGPGGIGVPQGGRSVRRVNAGDVAERELQAEHVFAALHPKLFVVEAFSGHGRPRSGRETPVCGRLTDLPGSCPSRHRAQPKGNRPCLNQGFHYSFGVVGWQRGHSPQKVTSASRIWNPWPASGVRQGA